MEFIFILMEINMTGNGLMTNIMDMELIHGKMRQNIKVNGLMGTDKAQGF